MDIDSPSRDPCDVVCCEHRLILQPPSFCRAGCRAALPGRRRSGITPGCGDGAQWLSAELTKHFDARGIVASAAAVPSWLQGRAVDATVCRDAQSIMSTVSRHSARQTGRLGSARYHRHNGTHQNHPDTVEDPTGRNWNPCGGVTVERRRGRQGLREREEMRARSNVPALVTSAGNTGSRSNKSQGQHCGMAGSARAGMPLCRGRDGVGGHGGGQRGHLGGSVSRSIGRSLC